MEGHAMPPPDLGHARVHATEDDDALEEVGVHAATEADAPTLTNHTQLPSGG